MTLDKLSSLCPNGHPMKMRNDVFPRIDKSGKTVPGDNLFCNFSKQPIIIKQGYFRCKYIRCDYDISLRIGLAAGFDLDEEEDEPVDI